MSVLTGRLPFIFIAAVVVLAVFRKPVLLSPLLMPGVVIAWFVANLPSGYELVHAMDSEGGPSTVRNFVVLTASLFWACVGFWLWRGTRKW